MLNFHLDARCTFVYTKHLKKLNLAFFFKKVFCSELTFFFRKKINKYEKKENKF